MADNELDELGPVDYLVVEFPPGQSHFTGEMAAELAKLVDAGTVRLLDLLIVAKDENGQIEGMEIEDLEEIDELRRAETQLADLLAADDVANLAAAMKQGRWLVCWFGRTLGPLRLPPPLAALAVSSSPTDGFRSKRSSPHSRRTR